MRLHSYEPTERCALIRALPRAAQDRARGFSGNEKDPQSLSARRVFVAAVEAHRTDAVHLVLPRRRVAGSITRGRRQRARKRSHRIPGRGGVHGTGAAGAWMPACLWCALSCSGGPVSAARGRQRTARSGPSLRSRRAVRSDQSGSAADIACRRRQGEATFLRSGHTRVSLPAARSAFCVIVRRRHTRVRGSLSTSVQVAEASAAATSLGRLAAAAPICSRRRVSTACFSASSLPTALTSGARPSRRLR